MAGSRIAAFALSEQRAGSDVAALATSARRDGDCYVLDGDKTWISNAGIAWQYVLFARTGEGPGARGISRSVQELERQSSRLVAWVRCHPYLHSC